jgi:hypothetical protein
MSRIISPAIRFSLSHYTINLNMATLACLGNPLCIRILFESERRLLAISVAGKDEFNSCNVPEKLYMTSRKELRITRMVLTEAFRVRMNWDPWKHYRVTGVHSPEHRAVLFELNEAVILPPRKKSGSSTGGY